MISDPYQASSYVIDKWGSLPLLVRIRDIVLTILIWGIYLYFMKDFAIFMRDGFLWAWHGFDNVDLYPGLRSLASVVKIIEIGTGIGALLIGWSFYNILYYGKRKRRQFAPAVTLLELADVYGVSIADLAVWQNSRMLTMYHDKEGRLGRVTRQ